MNALTQRHCEQTLADLDLGILDHHSLRIAAQRLLMLAADEELQLTPEESAKLKAIVEKR
jgi:hypothetical protein